MDTEQSSKFKGLLGTVIAGAVAAGGFVLVQLSEHLGQMGGEWLGGALFFPLVLVFLCCWIAGKLLKPELADLRIAVGITSAQAIIHLLGGLYLGGGALMSVLPDIVILGAGTAWLVARPGFWPIVLLLAFEGFAIVMNVIVLIESGFEMVIVKGLISTILIRLAAILFLYAALKSRRAKAPEAAKDGASEGVTAS
jgi:hypothetical protein